MVFIGMFENSKNLILNNYIIQGRKGGDHIW